MPDLLIDHAKQGVVFLAFIPGNPSIVSKLKEVYDAKRKSNDLFYTQEGGTDGTAVDLNRRIS